MLDKLREDVGKPLIINSAYRDPIHNARIGGAPLSRHKVGDAFDISTNTTGNRDLFVDIIYQFAKDIGFHGFGFYKTFIHVDNRSRYTEWHHG